jgi:hypothetical protein
MKNYKTCNDLTNELKVKRTCCSIINYFTIGFVTVVLSSIIPVIILPVGLDIVAKKVINDL